MLNARRSLAAMVLTVAMVVPVAGWAAPNTATFSQFVYQGSDPSDAVKLGPGQYRNPILQGFYPDPSVTRVGQDFFLVSSTFAWFPGLPVFHSTDLVHWQQIGNALDRPGMLDFKRLDLSRAVFAPSINHHDGLFYLLNTCVDCGGNFLITAKNPKGPWSDPVWLPEVGGIDPSIFFDDDGRAWIVNNDAPPGPAEYSGHRALWLQEFDLKAGKTVGPRTVLLDKGVDPSKKPIWPEGPNILKKDGWYYLVAAEGGTAEGHSQVVLRAKAVTGPYVPYADNPILTQRGLPKGRPLPITSAGHAKIVDTPDGQWWATFLAVRPYGDDLYNTGRETFLLPVEWKDGWPVILPNGQAVPYVAAAPKLPAMKAPPTSGAFTDTETFVGPELPKNWMTMRIPTTRWWSVGDGALKLEAREDRIGGNEQPSLWARRQQHMNATVQTTVRFTPQADGDKAGLVAVQNDDFYWFVGVAQAEGKSWIRVEKRTGKTDPTDGVVVAQERLTAKPGAPLNLRISATGGALAFAYKASKGRWRTLKADADGATLSTKVAGGFVGAMLGVYAHGANDH